MEDITCGLSELEIQERGKPFTALSKIFQAIKLFYIDVYEDDVNAGVEIMERDTFEAKVPEADLETVQVRYIPDYIRELKTKEEYWKKEFNYWGDLISKKNWKLYEKRVKDEMIRNKTVLKNLDKNTVLFSPKSGDDTHFSQSLDPERVQRLVDYLKEKESEDLRFGPLLRASIYTGNYRNASYIKYAAFATYGDFRERPSCLNLVRAAEEKSKNLLQNKT